MKIIKPSIEIITEQDPLKKIEICGRVCYKSEDKITADSAERFVKSLIKRGHESVLEHADYIVLANKFEYDYFNKVVLQLKEYGINPMLRTTANDDTSRYIISGNVRMWRDFMRDMQMIIVSPPFLKLFCNNILFDDVMPYISDISGTSHAKFINKSELLKGIETEIHRTETVRFIVDRGVSHEIVRHRKASFSQESTRYCNYGGEVTFIAPPYACYEWVKAMEYVEKTYSAMIGKGMKPQYARSVLPNSTKTEVIMTTYIQNWKHFFELRTAPAAHPQMRQVAIMLLKQFIEQYSVIFEDIKILIE